ncbi:MAG: histidine phosphatase family protein [Mycobacterium sp.]
MSGRLILVRHGQSHANVERRLDTRPPGADLTELGIEQARAFAGAHAAPIGLIAHSVAARATQTAAAIGTHLDMATLEVQGIHEVQVGDLENRKDEAAVAEFERIYQRWHEGALDERMPGGESGTDLLERYLPVVNEIRLRHLDDQDWGRDIVVVSHGAAIRLVGATLAGVDGSFALDHHLANTEAVTLAPTTDGRWSCLQWGALTPPFFAQPDVDPVQEALESADPMG